MATKLHCAYCFDVIVDDFDSKGCKTRTTAPVSTRSFGKVKYPMFVTWKKHTGDGKDWRLRGCIGTFSARDLTEGLREYALTSAFQDSRFSPLASTEIPFLSCDVSLLTDFEAAQSLDDWKVGVHGITIDFVASGKSYSATYLPEVASEQGWSKETTIDELIMKSGYKYSITSRLRKSIRVTRYQSSKCSLTYRDYLKFHQLPPTFIHLSVTSVTTTPALTTSEESDTDTPSSTSSITTTPPSTASTVSTPPSAVSTPSPTTPSTPSPSTPAKGKKNESQEKDEKSRKFARLC